jgi:hypothetical protein
MKMLSVVEALLLCIPGGLAWYLLDKIKDVDAQAAISEQIASSNGATGFRSGGGMDMTGHYIGSPSPQHTKYTVVFLLRGSTFSADLKFWESVNSLIPKGAGVRLIGYCDGDQCAEHLKNSSLSVAFPVVLYATVPDAQAVLNADDKGEALEIGSDLRMHKSIVWRTEHIYPVDIVGAMKYDKGE